MEELKRYKEMLESFLKFDFKCYSQFCHHLLELISGTPLYMQAELFAFCMENYGLVERSADLVLKGHEMAEEQYSEIYDEVSPDIEEKISKIDRSVSAQEAAKDLWPFFRDFGGQNMDKKAVALSLFMQHSTYVPWVRLPKVQSGVNEGEYEKLMMNLSKECKQIMAALCDKYKDPLEISMVIAKIISNKSLAETSALIHLTISNALRLFPKAIFINPSLKELLKAKFGESMPEQHVDCEQCPVKDLCSDPRKNKGPKKTSFEC